MNGVTPRRYDLVCFDVDGTLVEHAEDKVIWQVLTRRFLGDDAPNENRYLAYKAGRISYADWVALDVGDWQRCGATREQIVASLSAELRLVDGARETLAILKRRGAKLAVISGTLDIALDTLFPDHPFDDVFCNRIEFAADGAISGWQATAYDMDGKADALRLIAARENVSLDRCAFVGDHLNDLAAARAAGLAIAFNPKSPELEAAAQVVLRGPDLRVILEHL